MLGRKRENRKRQSLPGSQTGRTPAPTLPWGQWASLRYTSFAGGRGSCGFQEHSVMWIVLRAMSTLPSSTVQLPSASTSPSTHFVCLYTFYSYIFAAIFVQRSLYSTSTLIYVSILRLHSFVGVQWSLQCQTSVDVSILRLHSFVGVQQSLQCQTSEDVSILRLHSSVDVQRSP